MSESTKEVVETAALSALREEIEAIAKLATSVDRKKANSIIGKELPPTFVELLPTIAALVFVNANGVNRGLSVARIRNYCDDMKRGEWRKNHQGVAFYSNKRMADGQHRMAAVAISGTTQTMLLVNGMEEDSIDTVDRSTRRTAGESLVMKGMGNGKLLAKAGKEVMQYSAKVEGRSDRFTDIQIETFTVANRDLLQHGLAIGEDSTHNVTDPCLTRADAQMVACILVSGGWHIYLIEAFLSSLQRGVATYPEAPTTFLSKLLMRSKLSDRRKDVIPKFDQKALCLKALDLWAHNMSVTKLKWSLSEGVPTNVMPDDIKPKS